MNPQVVTMRITDKFILHNIFSFGAKPRDVLIRNIAVKCIQRWFRKYRVLDGDSYSGMIRTIFREYADYYVFDYPVFSVYKMWMHRPTEPIMYLNITFFHRSQVRKWIFENLNHNNLTYIGV